VRRGFGVAAGQYEGQRATKLVWPAGAKPLIEATVRQRPTLLAFHAGVKLNIAINTDGFPDLKVAGVRVIDV
jgi:hypothetical protein